MTRFSLMRGSKRTRGALALILALTWLSHFMPQGVQAADGDLDPSFGAGDPTVSPGVARTFFGANSTASQDIVNALGIQSTGKIIAGGYTQSGAASDFALARYNTNGTLDTTFGLGMTGKVTTDFNPNGDQMFDLAIAPGDKIVAVGTTVSPPTGAPCPLFNNDFAIAVYNADGSLDTGFNGTGKRTLDFFGCIDTASAVVVQPDGRIVVAGMAQEQVPMSGTTNFYLALVRLNPDGTLDSTFNGDGNNDGKVLHDINMTGLGSPNDLARIPSGINQGKFIVVGSSFTNDFFTARFNLDGSLDSSFGTSGKVITDFNMNSDIASSVALQTDGKIVVGGTTNSNDFAMARYNSDGSPDMGFGMGGKVITDFSGGGVTRTDQGKFVGVTSDGKIIMVGSSSGSDSTNNVAIARYLSDGTLDNTFGSSMNGKIVNHLGMNGMVNNAPSTNTGFLQTDGKILAAGGISTSGQTDIDFFVARFLNTSIDCTLTCPANITKSNDPNQCGAVVNYPAPNASGSCGTITCSPASGSFFPKGTTTVTCTSSAGPSCSFTVTVNDTQPPSITCPANVTTIAANTCPAGSSAAVNYPPPPASDNCPGVTTSCTPASGSTFMVGTSTVTCTATDTSGNTASCSFTVAVFSGCLQDDSNPAIVVLFNTVTGEYRFCCNGTAFTGKGTVAVRGCVVQIEHNTADRRVLIKVDFAAKTGTASLQTPPSTLRCTITDRNTTNNSCQCP